MSDRQQRRQVVVLGWRAVRGLVTNVDALRSLLGDAEKAREFAVVRLQGGTAPRRERLVSNFAAVAVELHRGLCCLLYYKLLTAAFAMERSLTETVMRALWIGFCADEHAMDGVRDDDPKAYPYWVEMQRQVEAMLDIETNEAAARDTWKRLCGATHAGIGQLRNHVGESGMLAPQFTEAEALSLLRAATGFVLSLLMLQMTQMGRIDLATEVADFHASFPSLRSDGVYAPLKASREAVTAF